ncbi:hypothetical protein KI688_007170 [Linnemannia hyalina]|uniref:Uncharacterized protein n=1 Tax=Linnemannia hyalina TaxID=64524 RepID=A0A9P7XLB1_9FUNG|nr:hypothetical protein KI688_007170 [Linnemannia hyalina]
MLIPPEQFGIVEPGLYRSDTLHPSHFPFIRSLNLKTAILLTPELPSRAMSNFFEENQIRLVDLALGSWKNNTNSNNSSSSGGNNPDGSGTGQGGAGGDSSTSGGGGGGVNTVTLTTPSIPAAPFQTSWWKPLSEELIKEGLEMILDVNNYPIMVMDTSIIVEYRAYAGNKARYVNEQFIELFDIDWITLPASLPTWWIEQEAMWHEEEEEREMQLQQEREAEADRQQEDLNQLTITSATAFFSS